MKTRLLTSDGSSRSRTERCCTASTLSMPSRLRPRLRFRKLEMFACFDALPKEFAEIILQDFEPHGPEYSTGLQHGAKSESFPQAGIAASLEGPTRYGKTR